jgi:hypothetical protein
MYTGFSLIKIRFLKILHPNFRLIRELKSRRMDLAYPIRALLLIKLKLHVNSYPLSVFGILTPQFHLYLFRCVLLVSTVFLGGHITL